jgi:hypothetical protein
MSITKIAAGCIVAAALVSSPAAADSTHSKATAQTKMMMKHKHIIHKSKVRTPLHENSQDKD